MKASFLAIVVCVFSLSCAHSGAPVAKLEPARRNIAVYQGNEVSEKDPYWHSTVKFEMTGGGTCSAVIVSERAVLTAGHCIHPKFKPLQIKFFKGQTEFATRAVTHFKLHPDYRNKLHDLALVFFEGGLPSKDFYRAPLLALDLLNSGHEVFLAGFGLIEKEKSDFRYSRLKVTSVIPQRFGAADASGGAQEGCEGDSGGPAYLKVRDRLVLVGIVTVSPDGSCLGKADYTVFTSVPFYLNWITETR